MIVYFLKNWRWSVEAKCVLKKLIIEVSKEKVTSQNNEVNARPDKSTKKNRHARINFSNFYVHVYKITLKQKTIGPWMKKEVVL